MSEWSSDPDYTLRWPPDVFAEEVRRLIKRAEQNLSGRDWEDEVETLLRQAFGSEVPIEDFRAATAPPQPWYSTSDEEPF